VVAPPKDIPLNTLLPGFGMVIYWNMLDMPSGVVPITQVNFDETFFKDSVGDVFSHQANSVMINSIGMPVGV